MAAQSTAKVTVLPASALGPTPLISGGAPQLGQPYWNAGTVQTEPGVKLTLQQLVDTAIAAGFPRTGPGNAAEAAAVAEYESSGMPGWYNPEYSVQPRGSTQGSYGLTQIYRARHGDVASQYNLFNPLGSMEATLTVVRQNIAAGRPPWTGWTSVYGNKGVGIAAGGYAKWLPAAEADAAKSTASPLSGSGDSGNPILQGILSNIPGVNLIAQAGGDAATAATNAGLPNPFDPATWLAGFKSLLVDTGFVVLALLVIVLGMLLVFWPQVKSAAGEGARAARDTALVAA